MTQQPTMPPQDASGSFAQNGGGFNSSQPAMPYGGTQQAPQNGFAQVPYQPQVQQPKKKKKHGCLIALLVIVALAVAVSIATCVKNAPEPLDWPTTGLATMLPEPPHDKGTIISNSDTLFSADVEQCSADDYSSYVTACSEKGFNVEAESDTDSYTAFNSEGYKLSLMYWDSSEKIDISLDAPEEMGEISWPDAGPASLIPAPVSTTGYISTDSSKSFFAYIGETTQDDFQAYADECSAAGFSEDYESGETWYRAKNAAGDSLSLSYEGFNTMTVDVDLADDAAPNVSSDASADADVSSESGQAESSSTADASGVTPEFKASMDEYEAFIDEYVEFMNTYAESDNALAMAADYADMMAQYADTMEAMNAIDENSLSDADLAYYLEAQNRINAKLLEISSS